MMGTKLALTGMALGAAALAFQPTAAQAEWPERPITVVVMYGAGGGTDTVIRTLVGEMAKSTGWKINVINKPGAVGGIATKYVNGKKADGYTLLGAANYNKYASVMGHTKTRAWKDWQYMQAANSRGSWSVRPDSKFKTFADVIAAAKANPKKPAMLKTCLTAVSKVSTKAFVFSFSCSCAFVLAFNDSFSSLVD